jgi:hypothetical protein
MMTDDIVTRLRNVPAVIEALGYEWVNDLDAARLVMEAADEIERLRKEVLMLEQWKKLAIQFGTAASYSEASNQLEESRRQFSLETWDMLTVLDTDDKP